MKGVCLSPAAKFLPGEARIIVSNFVSVPLGCRKSST